MSNALVWALRRVSGSGFPGLAPHAACYLGYSLGKQGEVDAARTAFQRAIDSGHREWAPKAAFYLVLQPVRPEIMEVIVQRS